MSFKQTLTLGCSLLAILAVGVIVRYPLLFEVGHDYDVETEASWMRSAALIGVAETYAHPLDTIVPLHGPVEIFLDDVVGHAYFAWASPNDTSLDVQRMVPYLKIPELIADLAICVLIFSMLCHMGHPWKGLAGSALYAVHPYALADIAWGQTDAIVTAFLMGALVASMSRRWFACGALVALAYLTKPTAALAMPLILACFLVSRRRWELVAGGAAAVSLFALPFVLTGHVFDFIGFLFGAPQMTEPNALNLQWILATFNAQWWFLNVFPGLLAPRVWSFLTFCAIAGAYLFAMRRTFSRHHDVVLAACTVAFLFFFLQVGVRNRYIFTCIALSVPLLFTSAEGALVAAVTTICAYYEIVMENPAMANPFMDAITSPLHLSDIVVASGYIFVLGCLMALSVFRAATVPSVCVAGAAGIEPATPGFGDLCSAN